MTRMTITEALSEINLVKKKLEASKVEITGNVARAKHLDDPYASAGGSSTYNARKLHSIYDLQTRLVSLRSAIARANLDNKITVGSREMSIHDWLTWKREVSAFEDGLLRGISEKVKTHLNHTAKNPSVYKDNLDNTKLVEWELLVDQVAITKFQETLMETQEKLDGQLSLKNATITVEI